MDKGLKLKMADMMLEFMYQYQGEKTHVPRDVGTLNQAQGIQGFKRADVGTPVFDVGDRYMIMLESLDGKRNVELTYYKETFKKVIDFYDTEKKA